MKTDQEFWAQAQEFVAEFMTDNYDKCEGWKCGVSASKALFKFQKWVLEHKQLDGTISYHTFYSYLRGLGYDIPVVKGGFDANKTKIKGITRRELP